MAQVIVDPEKMRLFERALRELRGNIAQRRNILAQQVKEVSSFWDDQKYRDFQRNQETVALELQAFENIADNYCEFLLRKAAAADAYLGNRR